MRVPSALASIQTCSMWNKYGNLFQRHSFMTNPITLISTSGEKSYVFSGKNHFCFLFSLQSVKKENLINIFSKSVSIFMKNLMMIQMYGPLVLSSQYLRFSHSYQNSWMCLIQLPSLFSTSFIQSITGLVCLFLQNIFKIISAQLSYSLF